MMRNVPLGSKKTTGPVNKVSDWLRLHASYDAKITKIQTPLVRFARLFHNQTVFQKFECTFFDQVDIDAKSVLTFEKRPLVTELKLKT